MMRSMRWRPEFCVSKNPRMSASSTHIDHGWLIKFIEYRIADRKVLRLIQKWLRAGASASGQEVGSPQGATVSLLLANICGFGYEHSTRRLRTVRSMCDAPGRAGPRRLSSSPSPVVLPGDPDRPPAAACFFEDKYASRSRSTVTWCKSAVNRFVLSAFAALRTRSRAHYARQSGSVSGMRVLPVRVPFDRVPSLRNLRCRSLGIVRPLRR